MNENQHCQELGCIRDKDKIVGWDILIIREDKSLRLTVGTSDYIRFSEELLHNYPMPPEAGPTPPIYPLEDVSSIDRVCQQLAGKSIEELWPYCPPEKDRL